MVNKRVSFHSRGVLVKETHEIERDKAIIEFQEQVRKLTRELEEVE